MSKKRLSSIPGRLDAAPSSRLKTPSQSARIVGGRLTAIRARHFRDRPACVRCLSAGVTRAATELDHIVPLWAGGRDVEGNRQGLCHACHADKSAGEARARSGGGG